MSQLPIRPPSAPPPIFNLPIGVKSLILVLICIHAAQHVLPTSVNHGLEHTLGYVPLRFWMVLHGEWRGPSFEIELTPLTYLFLHASWLHLGVNVLSLAAFGTAVENLAGPRFMVWLFMVSGVIGAFTEFAVEPRSPEIIIGASAGISGLFAVAFLSMAHKQNMSRLKTALLVGMMVAILVVTGIGGMPGTTMPVAWIAHVGGFLTGVAADGCAATRRGALLRYDLGWFVAITALPMFVLLVNVAWHH
jgi:membrane associated rhomboid family serine protease